jgi:thioredoxin 1
VKRWIILSVFFLSMTAALLLLQRKELPAMAAIDELRRDAHASQKILMVEFWAGWCGDCVQLSASLEEEPIRHFVKEHFIISKVDVGEFDRNLDIAKALGLGNLSEIPTAVFFAPGDQQPVTRRGTRQILEYINATYRRMLQGRIDRVLK